MEYAVLAAFVVLLLGAGVVTALKGKWGTLLVGLVFGPAWFFGAVRLARPGSVWDRKLYDAAKRERARNVAPRRRKLAVAGLAASGLVVVAVFGTLKAYRFPSSAMESTLRCARPGPGCTGDGSDRVVAVRYLFRKRPSRGDIVAFEAPERARTACGAGGTFAHRIIGLPGEQWEMRNGDVYIDGKRLNEPYVPAEGRDSDNRPRQRIPDAHYVLLGDNRPRSCDSRMWGLLPRDRLIARVVFRYWPTGRVGTP